MAALHANGARHAHLAAPFSRQHDKDQKDQQHAGQDREEAKEREDRGKDAARRVAHGEQSRFVERVDDIKGVQFAKGHGQLGFGVGGQIFLQQPAAESVVTQNLSQAVADTRLCQFSANIAHPRDHAAQRAKLLHQIGNDLRTVKAFHHLLLGVGSRGDQERLHIRATEGSHYLF